MASVFMFMALLAVLNFSFVLGTAIEPEKVATNEKGVKKTHMPGDNVRAWEFNPAPLPSDTPRGPSDPGEEVCEEVEDDMPKPGCTRMSPLGRTEVKADGLPAALAKTNVMQSCDNRIAFALLTNRKWAYRLSHVALSISFNFYNIDEAYIKKTVESDADAKKMLIAFDTTFLTTPVMIPQCCGSKGPLYIEMKAAYKYKVEEEGVARRLWKWSNETMEVKETFSYAVKCAEGKVNMCKARKCENDNFKFPFY